ncbi:hypothetical protein JYP49_05595 [Nitratireductor aquimarinus]|uniref:helix-turn-helix transcriptional regulator n=1 Tax=Nitratireductor TaxID=245876 RepID=UPI0019D3CDBF|nr:MULTISPECIES: hypothetical protein [Nitratireductor]MBN7776719.1 hypothetical protein [Nitratireductor pacificus]MBN7780053.1 hypothetical protein [Nitratireductor pacificus]MBN7788860.1 hypothetical protein [Nitratireductor aquimarinus]MBY6098928.1 hypothetical protein [Nitratireductor aquimarinus]MCA1259412.1 hypothetical protein [Nitratireductor aquimarinus]
MPYNHKTPAGFNRNLVTPTSNYVNNVGSGSDGFLPARHVLDRYRISQMTLWRWLADESMAFPKPVYLGRYRYWRIADIQEWEAAQEARGAA